MLTVEPITHIGKDERGVAWIDDTNTKVIEVVMDWMANRSSAEEMHHQHPHLSPAQIHAAMAYYYDHQAEIDAQIERSLQLADEMRAQAINQPDRAEMLARLHRQ